jgi:3',5'-cyclic AMP phosphodiesterase CpdA
MTLLHLSDTHGLHRQIENLPLAEVIVHTGDFCEKGTVEEVEDFVEWFASLPHKHKIFVAGNHDDCLHGAAIEGLPDGVHYLCHSGIEIDGVRFYGLPMFVADELSGEYEKAISRIPSDTDVLITHQPPYGILDVTDGVHYGNISLLGRVLSIKPRLHLFGHVHKAN